MNKVRVSLAVAGMTLGALALPTPAGAQVPGGTPTDPSAALDQLDLPTLDDAVASFQSEFEKSAGGPLASLGQLLGLG